MRYRQIERASYVIFMIQIAVGASVCSGPGLVLLFPIAVICVIVDMLVILGFGGNAYANWNGIKAVASPEVM